MNLNEFINHIVDLGIEAAKKDYAHPRSALKLRGAIAGFEACRGLDRDELQNLLLNSSSKRQEAHRNDDPKYWKHACYHAEIEWVCNCVSVILINEGQQPIIQPTANGTLMANKILMLEKTL